MEIKYTEKSNSCHFLTEKIKKFAVCPLTNPMDTTIYKMSFSAPVPYTIYPITDVLPQYLHQGVDVVI
jgi:hypothetical protein